MSITAAGAVYLLNLLRAGDQPRANFYVALIRNEPPGYTVDGHSLDEPPFVDYARAPFANESAHWSLNPSAATLTSALDIFFPVASSAWGTIRYWAVCDRASGGDALFVGQFDQPFYVDVGAAVQLPVGLFEISIRGTEWRMS